MTGVFHIAIAMKPTEGTFAQNALKHGVAGLWIDGCRIGTVDVLKGGSGGLLSNVRDSKAYPAENGYEPSPSGRWPANVVLDDSERVLGMFPKQKSPATYTRNVIGHSSPAPMNRVAQIDDFRTVASGFGDSGSASRFFKQISGFCAREEADSSGFR